MNPISYRRLCPLLCRGLLILVFNFCLLVSAAWAQGQSVTVTGVVRNARGEVLAGATVTLKGSSVSVVTGADGRYRIVVPTGAGTGGGTGVGTGRGPGSRTGEGTGVGTGGGSGAGTGGGSGAGPEARGAVLTITHVGYEDLEIRVDGRTTIDVVLRERAAELGDVVVVGYGTQKKADLTGAIATVSAADLNRRIATDPTQLLQGKLPGLSLTQTSGEAGNEGFVLRVRGLGTYSSAGSSPLVIVDGLPGSLSALDPQNIESITLLKDAASSAIYGTRAANGVLLVTTKQGRDGRFQLSYDYSVGITRPTALPKDLVYNSATYMQLWNQAAVNSGYANQFTPAMIAAYTNPTNKKLYPNFNWLNALMRTVPVQTHHLGFTGGRNGTTYNIGLGYVSQPDIMIGFSYQKYNLQFNLNSRVNEVVSFGSSLTFNYSRRLYASRGSQDQFLSDLSQEPMYGPQLPDGSGRYTNSVYPSVETPNKNPVAIAQNAVVNTNDFYSQSSLYVAVRPLKGLEWRTSGGFNFDFSKTYDFKPVIYQYNWFAGPTDLPERTLDVNGQGLTVTDNNTIYPVGYTQLTYTREVAEHHFKLLAGAQEEYNKTQLLVGTRNTPFSTNTLQELNAGPSGSQINSGTSAIWSLRSYYGRLNYDYREKYLLEANARYDASSRFPPANRWGFFPSVSAGWVMTREKFLDKVSWLDNLKLRGSWGVLGNQNISNYPYQSVYSNANYYNSASAYAYSFSGTTLNSGVAQNSLTDPTIKWETTRVIDFGADLGFLKRFTLGADWYDKLTYDILATGVIPAYVGLTAPTINNGKMRNTGVELSAQYGDKFGKLTLSVGGNIQINRNTLVKYGPETINTGNNTINVQGKPYGSYYMYQYAGIFQSAQEIAKSPIQQYNPQPGYMKFKDVTGNDTVNANDEVIVSGVYPKFEYSFNASAGWKNWDLSMFLYGSYGEKQYVNGWAIQPFDQGSPPPSYWLNAWTPANPSKTLPMIYITGQGNISSNVNTPSTYYLKSASYLRVKNIQLGYTLPAGVARRVAMSSLRFYFAGDNLFTFTKFPGLDPERVTSSSNTRFAVHPQNQVYAFGVKAVF